MTPEAQLEILTAHAVDLQDILKAELLAKLEQVARVGCRLRVKAGVDPTAPDIHLGHTLVMQQMRRFQDLGHVGVLVVGDFTARIGDPTGKSTTRPRLTAEAVAAERRHLPGAGLQGARPRPHRTALCNSERLEPSGRSGASIELAASYSLARMLEREDFKTRFHEGRTISLHELLYPLLAGAGLGGSGGRR